MRYLIGIGNYSMFDDSIGIRIIENIIAKNMEKDFRALDLSGNALNLLSYLGRETEKIIIVDTARLNLPPGDYRFFVPESVRSVKDLTGITSHEGDMVKVIELARETGYYIPRIIFMGIEPKTIKSEFGLSEILKDRIQRYTEAAIKKLKE